MLVAAIPCHGVRGKPSLTDTSRRRRRQTGLHVSSNLVSSECSPLKYLPRSLTSIYSDVSRNSEISIQCYLRTEQPTGGIDGIADDMGNDIFMGGVRFTPDFDNMGAPQEQWCELSGGGKILIAVAYQPSSVRIVAHSGYLQFADCLVGPIIDRRRFRAHDCDRQR